MSAALNRAKFLRTQAAFLADQPWGSLLGGKDLYRLMHEADAAYLALDPFEASAYLEWNRPAMEKVLNDPKFGAALSGMLAELFAPEPDA